MTKQRTGFDQVSVRHILQPFRLQMIGCTGYPGRCPGLRYNTPLGFKTEKALDCTCFALLFPCLIRRKTKRCKAPHSKTADAADQVLPAVARREKKRRRAPHCYVRGRQVTPDIFLRKRSSQPAIRSSGVGSPENILSGRETETKGADQTPKRA